MAMTASADRVAFTGLDEAIHLLDTPSEPWTIQLEARVRAHLDEDRLRSAVQQGVSAHAMARARHLSRDEAGRQLTWEITATLDVDPLQVVDCDDDGALAALRGELYSASVPLSQSPPLRVRLARHPEGDVVMICTNHAAFDGYGALRVLQSVARAYAGVPDPAPPVALCEARDIEGHLGHERPSLRSRRWRALARKALDLSSRPARLGTDQPGAQPGYGFHHLCVPVPAPRGDATVNDLLVAALNMAVDGWNAEHGVRCRRIGLLMPVNLRPKAWKTDIVTNYVMETWVSTRAGDRNTPQGVLDTVVGQTRRIKGGGAAALFKLLRYAPRLPPWVKRLLSPILRLTGNRLIGTAVMSNLGRIDDPPSFGPDGGEVDAMWFSAPARMPCGLSLGAVSLGKQMYLAFRYRRALWGPAAAIRFAERFQVELNVLTRETS